MLSNSTIAGREVTLEFEIKDAISSKNLGPMSTGVQPKDGKFLKKIKKAINHCPIK